MQIRVEPWRYFNSFKQTEVTRFLDNTPHMVKAIFSGNRAGKTSSIAEHYVKRVLGIHPNERLNKLMKKVRCMSPSLPDSDSIEENDNSQYIELKKMLPPELIKKDVTARAKNLVVNRPHAPNDPCIFEFRSNQQDLQSLGRIPIDSLWHDEETPEPHRNECKARLIDRGGDEIFSYTAVNPITYLYDLIYQRANIIIRTDTIVEKLGLTKTESKDPNSNIAVMVTATDDNPVLDPEAIERMFEDIIDPDELATRRYGVFRQISGSVFKTYNPAICYIDLNKYFPEGLPHKYVHARGIDYHESRIPWSIGWLAISPTDEWFLYNEFHPVIDGPHSMTTYEISKSIARQSGDYYFSVNLIDPLAKKKQASNNFSVVDDMNRYFDELRKNEGVGTPSWWEGWDTKGTSGRQEIAKRFKNACRCGKPFNNQVIERGRKRFLPTLWIGNSCPNFNKSIINWRYREHVQAATKAFNDMNPVPSGKYSHDCMVLEAWAKDMRLLNARHSIYNPPAQISPFVGAGARV